MLNLVNQTHTVIPTSLIEKLVTHAYQRLEVDPNRTLSLVFVDQTTMQSYNAQFKDKDRPTDVLTFPSEASDELGDVIIALDIALDQAQAYGHSFEREVCFLIVHGFLHTLGFVHDSPEDEQVMIDWQNTLLNELNITR